jgi:hypothetical protein
MWSEGKIQNLWGISSRSRRSPCDRGVPEWAAGFLPVNCFSVKSQVTVKLSTRFPPWIWDQWPLFLESNLLRFKTSLFKHTHLQHCISPLFPVRVWIQIKRTKISVLACHYSWWTLGEPNGLELLYLGKNGQLRCTCLLTCTRLAH